MLPTRAHKTPCTASRAARLCHAVAWGGQLIVPQDIAQAFLDRCGGPKLASLMHASSLKPAGSSDVGGDVRNSLDLHLERQASAPAASKRLAARLRRSLAGDEGCRRISRGGAWQPCERDRCGMYAFMHRCTASARPPVQLGATL